MGMRRGPGRMSVVAPAGRRPEDHLGRAERAGFLRRDHDLDPPGVSTQACNEPV